ncbi:hypothetical protein L9F63_025258, partial [Diploptera punctata]
LISNRNLRSLYFNTKLPDVIEHIITTIGLANTLVSKASFVSNWIAILTVFSLEKSSNKTEACNTA